MDHWGGRRISEVLAARSDLNSPVNVGVCLCQATNVFSDFREQEWAIGS